MPGVSRRRRDWCHRRGRYRRGGPQGTPTGGPGPTTADSAATRGRPRTLRFGARDGQPLRRRRRRQPHRPVGPGRGRRPALRITVRSPPATGVLASTRTRAGRLSRPPLSLRSTVLGESCLSAQRQFSLQSLGLGFAALKRLRRVGHSVRVSVLVSAVVGRFSFSWGVAVSYSYSVRAESITYSEGEPTPSGMGGGRGFLSPIPSVTRATTIASGVNYVPTVRSSSTRSID